MKMDRTVLTWRMGHAFLRDAKRSKMKNRKIVPAVLGVHFSFLRLFTGKENRLHFQATYPAME
jgi:hypothetical protein